MIKDITTDSVCLQSTSLLMGTLFVQRRRMSLQDTIDQMILFYEEQTGKPINYSDIQSWYCSFDDCEIGMKIIHQAEFKVKGLMNEIVVCYYMFGYYLVDVWFHTEETDDNSPSRINYIKTKYFPVAEKEYYKKISEINKQMEERENVC